MATCRKRLAKGSIDKITQDVPFVSQERLYFLWGKYVSFFVGKTLTKMWFFVGRPLMRYAAASR